ncbi:MAG: hypothetical protein HYS55_03960 [Candidatus Omnitrophica bacterium]|nr:hypothetical protein [Candidatus Omnitrophota bacterium]
MKKAKAVCLIAVLMLVLTRFSYAEEITSDSPSCGVCQGAESQNFGKSAPGKIGRGLVNTGLGWTNLLAQPIQAGSSGGNVFTGIGKGLWMTVVRTLQGVTEFGLFWLPPGPEESLKYCALGDLGITGR